MRGGEGAKESSVAGQADLSGARSKSAGSYEKRISAEDSDDWFIRKLHQSVIEARKNETWRDEYMTSRDIERRGYLQGEKAANKANALRMLEEGMDLDLISKVVDLSPEELQAIIEEFEGRKA